MQSTTGASPRDTDRAISDPTTGETVTFVETAGESGGGRVIMSLDLAPGASVPPHSHPFEEAFECTSGAIELRLAGRDLRLEAGSSVTAPPDTVHGLRNSSKEPATVRVVGRPGAIAEHSLRVKFLLSRDGYLPTGGGPPKHLLLGAVVLHRAGMYFPPLPVWLFRAMIAGLAALGRWRGRERFLLERYPEYRRFLESATLTRPGSSPTEASGDIRAR